MTPYRRRGFRLLTSGIPAHRVCVAFLAAGVLRRRLLATWLLGALCLGSWACESNPRWPDLDPVEKAKWITKYRDLANRSLQEFRHSRELDDLLKVVEYERITTEISPDTCSSCYREYGLSLSMAGRYYGFRYQDAVLATNSELPAGSEIDPEADAEAARQKMREYFINSERAYSTFFSHPDTYYVDPEDIARVMQDQAYMENWARCLDYLKLYEAQLGTKIPEVQRDYLEDLKREYRQKARLQRERESARSGLN
jgi:hypothetical protein